MGRRVKDTAIIQQEPPKKRKQKPSKKATSDDGNGSENKREIGLEEAVMVLLSFCNLRHGDNWIWAPAKSGAVQTD
jgi:hypothetical protein